MYKDTITLFNRYTTKDRKIIWYPTVLHGVNLNVDRVSIVAKYGSNSQDNAVLNVKYHSCGDVVMVGDKRYLLPKAWNKQLKDALAESMTFAADAQEFDFFYVGEWEDNDPIADSDYTSGFYSYMKKAFDEVFAITSVAKYSAVPHFEVVAK